MVMKDGYAQMNTAALYSIQQTAQLYGQLKQQVWIQICLIQFNSLLQQMDMQ